MRAGSASVMLEGTAGSGEAARQAGGTGRCALLTGSVAAPAARLLVRSEVLALKSAHSGGCVRAVLFRGGARCVAEPRRVDRRSSPEVARSGRSVFMLCDSGWVRSSGQCRRAAAGAGARSGAAALTGTANPTAITQHEHGATTACNLR